VTNPKSSKEPAIKELKKSLSRRMCAFLVPMRLTNSTVCWGVKASILAAFVKEIISDRGGKLLGWWGVLLWNELDLPGFETRRNSKRQKEEVRKKENIQNIETLPEMLGDSSL